MKTTHPSTIIGALFLAAFIGATAMRWATSKDMQTQDTTGAPAPSTAPAEPAISRIPVESSQLKSIGYDPETQTLEVEFASGSGGIYRYSNFEQDAWDDFMKSESKGSFFIRNIKKNPAKYPYRRMP